MTTSKKNGWGESKGCRKGNHRKIFNLDTGGRGGEGKEKFLSLSLFLSKPHRTCEEELLLSRSLFNFWLYTHNPPPPTTHHPALVAGS